MGHDRHRDSAAATRSELNYAGAPEEGAAAGAEGRRTRRAAEGDGELVDTCMTDYDENGGRRHLAQSALRLGEIKWPRNFRPISAAPWQGSAHRSTSSTDGPAGRGGFRHRHVQRFDEPPTLLVCMNGARRRPPCSCQPALLRQRADAWHMHLAGQVARRPGTWRALLGRALADADIRHAGAVGRDRQFRCGSRDVHVVGTHNVMIGRVIDVRHGSSGSRCSMSTGIIRSRRGSSFGGW